MCIHIDSTGHNNYPHVGPSAIANSTHSMHLFIWTLNAHAEAAKFTSHFNRSKIKIACIATPQNVLTTSLHFTNGILISINATRPPMPKLAIISHIICNQNCILSNANKCEMFANISASHW